jgi:cytochrome P450
VQRVRGPFPPLPEAPHGDDLSDLIEKYRETFIAHDMRISFDPPEHTDYRGLMMRLLTPKRLHENEAFMERLANQRVDPFASKGTCDFIAEYTQQGTVARFRGNSVKFLAENPDVQQLLRDDRERIPNSSRRCCASTAR